MGFGRISGLLSDASSLVVLIVVRGLIDTSQGGNRFRDLQLIRILIETVVAAESSGLRFGKIAVLAQLLAKLGKRSGPEVPDRQQLIRVHGQYLTDLVDLLAS